MKVLLVGIPDKDDGGYIDHRCFVIGPDINTVKDAFDFLDENSNRKFLEEMTEMSRNCFYEDGDDDVEIVFSAEERDRFYPKWGEIVLVFRRENQEYSIVYSAQIITVEDLVT